MIAAITPTRGDRPEFVAWQKARVKQLGYGHHYIIDHPPISEAVDIYQRIALGVSKAQADGFKWVSIIEDDDYYGMDYLYDVKELISLNPQAVIVGDSVTDYYNLRNGTYDEYQHPRRSSLFKTTFQVRQFSSFPCTSSPFFDIVIWKHVIQKNLPYALGPLNAIGIKHGIGKVGGSGHSLQMPHRDTPARKWLQNRLDSKAFDFYFRLGLTL